DDVHEACGHPGAAVWPTAIAVGEHVGANGREVVAAACAGYQVMALAMGPVYPSIVPTGWNGTKFGALLGSAAVPRKLLGATPEQTAHAMAIAYTEGTTTNQAFETGGDVLRLTVAFAVRSGIESALLAADGVTGPVGILEGGRGLYRTFGVPDAGLPP